MLRTFVIFVGLVMMLGAGIAVAAWPGAGADERAAFATQAQFENAYATIRPGLPASSLSGLGFDFTAVGTEKFAGLGVMERFMPRDAAGFDRLDPRVQDCFIAPERCTAYIFHLPIGSVMPRPQAKVTVLIESGRVAWMSADRPAGVSVRERLRRLAMN